MSDRCGTCGSSDTQLASAYEPDGIGYVCDNCGATYSDGEWSPPATLAVLWIPIAEQAPHDGETVLVYDGETWAEAQYQEHRMYKFHAADERPVPGVTHWARVPLPR